jgi:hypothetical protein
MHLSVDKAISKIEKQLKKYKEKGSDHRLRVNGKPVKILKKTKPVSLPKEQEEQPLVAVGKAAVRITKREKVSVDILTIEQALSEMKSNKKEFFLFRSSAHHQLNLLYQKKGGAIGLIEFIDTVGAGI